MRQWNTDTKKQIPADTLLFRLSLNGKDDDDEDGLDDKYEKLIELDSVFASEKYDGNFKKKIFIINLGKFHNGNDIGFATWSSQFGKGEKKFIFPKGSLKLPDIEKNKGFQSMIKDIEFRVNGYPVLNLPNSTYYYNKF